MAAFPSYFLVFVLICLCISQQGCSGKSDECVRKIRVTKRMSQVFYYRCGWRGFWRCPGKRYYLTYATVRKCCSGYEKVDGKCLKVTTTASRTTTASATPPISSKPLASTTPRPRATVEPRPTCGVSSFDVNQLIVGGTPASRGQYPWLVSIVSTSHFCGGMIIDDHWIVTAAHCVKTWWDSDYQYIYRVRVGEHDRYMTDAKEVTMAIEKVIPHPDYSDVIVTNDIALIKTSKPIVFNDYVKPICLPSANMRLPLTSDVEIAGWGLTDPTYSSATSRVLMAARMRLTSASVCRSVYGWSLITDRVLCVTDGYGNRRKSACNGDSGGPLMLRKDDVVFGIGITSFGASSGCAGGDPVVYTDVTKYVNWINEQRANN